MEVAVVILWYGSHLPFWQPGLMRAGVTAFWTLIICAPWVVVTGHPTVRSRQVAP